MARTDDTPSQITSPEYRPAHKSELESYLLKEAEGGVTPERNEATPKKPAVDLYADPPGRKDGQNEDSRWGVETQGELNHHNDATYAETKKDRLGVMDKAFAKMPAAEAEAGKTVASLFDHARGGDFATNSGTLLNKAKVAAPTQSLSERVRNLTGRE